MTPSLEWALQVHSLEDIQRYRTLVLQGDLVDCLAGIDPDFPVLPASLAALRCFASHCDL